MQQIMDAENGYGELDAYLKGTGKEKLLLVCGSSIKNLAIGRYFDSLEERLGIKAIKFSRFEPNPTYESVVEGVKLLNAERCQLIVAVGGGSAMDVAKCIKLYSNMDCSQNYLEQVVVPNNIELVAVPTTAGTGSEATRFAVIYYKGEKQSVTDDGCIPSAVLIDASVLDTLPGYQRKATMMDALCHATESFWSINSTEESQAISVEAIQLVLNNCSGYLANTKEGNYGMLQAANMAGKAINIAQTTAGHAMCYKLTSLYGVPHGHAAALSVSKLFPYMIDNINRCVDPRGGEYLEKSFQRLAAAYGCSTPKQAAEKFDGLLKGLELEIPKAKPQDYEVLTASVNPTRMKNNPVRMDMETINMLYHQIFRCEE